MKFTAAASVLLCADLALGARWTEKRRENRAARQLAKRSGDTVRKSQPMIKANVEGVESNNSYVEYSSNWAGAVLSSTSFTEVTGTIVVPTLSATSSRTESAGAAWVGIDGDTCQTAILQTGIDWYVEGSSVSFDAWYEWYPDYSYDFSGITISEGDSILMSVVATSKTSGTATIENLTTGVTVSETFTDVTDGSLCEYDAEWIVEDFEECSTTSCSLVPFADFGTVTFTDVSAVQSGATVSPADAAILDIEQSSKVLTSCSASSSEVSCTYV
ncbi:unnamed protein product [Discula destructiva]